MIVETSFEVEVEEGGLRIKLDTNEQLVWFNDERMAIKAKMDTYSSLLKKIFK
jgi:hypothetical protein